MYPSNKITTTASLKKALKKRCSAVEGRTENSARVKNEVKDWNMNVKVLLTWIEELWEAQKLAFIRLRGHIAD